MKYLLISSILLSASVFAQQDDYHVREKSKCQEESCLVHEDIQIGFSSFYDERDDFTYTSLNTDSSLEDVVYKDASLCFTGEAQRVCEIIESLSGNSSYNYSKGAHSYIENLNCRGSNEINLSFHEISDYSNKPIQHTTFISRCEK